VKSRLIALGIGLAVGTVAVVLWPDSESPEREPVVMDRNILVEPIAPSTPVSLPDPTAVIAGMVSMGFEHDDAECFVHEVQVDARLGRLADTIGAMQRCGLMPTIDVEPPAESEPSP
jgi:hypothetical protein